MYMSKDGHVMCNQYRTHICMQIWLIWRIIIFEHIQISLIMISFVFISVYLNAHNFSILYKLLTEERNSNSHDFYNYFMWIISSLWEINIISFFLNENPSQEQTERIIDKRWYRACSKGLFLCFFELLNSWINSVSIAKLKFTSHFSFLLFNWKQKQKNNQIAWIETIIRLFFFLQNVNVFFSPLFLIGLFGKCPFDNPLNKLFSVDYVSMKQRLEHKIKSKRK